MSLANSPRPMPSHSESCSLFILAFLGRHVSSRKQGFRLAGKLWPNILARPTDERGTRDTTFSQNDVTIYYRSKWRQQFSCKEH